MRASPKLGRGFTLVELMLVIAIIAILTSIITISLGISRQKSRDSKRIADVGLIKLALSSYYNDNLFYPKNIYAPSNTTASSDPANGLAPAYISVVPKDPSANTSDNCNSTGANGLTSCYHYNAFTTASSGICNATTNFPVIYHLGTSFEDTTNTALTQDSDAGDRLIPPFSTTYYPCTSAPGAFHGNAPNCTATTAGTDNCYDLTP